MEATNTIETKPLWKSRKGIKNKLRTRIRQAKVWNDVIENDKTVAEAMRDNGYKAGYNSSVLQKTKTWGELLARDLPDKLLSKVAKSGLKAKTGDKAKDYEIRHKYLETSLKMTGKLIDRTDITSAGQPLVAGFRMMSPADRVIEGETVEDTA